MQGSSWGKTIMASHWVVAFGIQSMHKNSTNKGILQIFELFSYCKIGKNSLTVSIQQFLGLYWFTYCYSTQISMIDVTSAKIKWFWFIRTVEKYDFTVSLWLFFSFCKRRDPLKDLKDLLQGWKNALGLWIQEKFHQKYTGMFTDLLRMVKKSWRIGARTV